MERFREMVFLQLMIPTEEYPIRDEKRIRLVPETLSYEHYSLAADYSSAAIVMELVDMNSCAVIDRAKPAIGLSLHIFYAQSKSAYCRWNCHKCGLIFYCTQYIIAFITG